MANKYNSSKYKYPSIDPHPPSLIPALQRQSFNRVIIRLNEQNEYLSQNMKQLIMQNLALKNKLYHQADSTYRAKDYAKYDVEQQVRRTELSYRQKTQQSKTLKTQESRSHKRPTAWKMPANRQTENQSVIKKPTIIEGLSQSQFENQTQINKSKNGEGRKGILLSKQVQKMNKQKQKEEKRQNQQDKEIIQSNRRNEMKEEDQLQEKVKVSQKLYTPVSKVETERKDNPQNNEAISASKHKKDNTPYLKVKDPLNGNYTMTYHTPSKNHHFNNKAYLDYSQK